VDLVKALTRGVHRGLEAEGAFAAFQVVVDSLGHADAVDAMFDQVGRAVMVPSPPMHTTASISLARRWSYTRSVTSAHSVFPLRSIANIADWPGCWFPEWFRLGEDVGDVVPTHKRNAVLDEPQEPVLDAVDLEAVRHAWPSWSQPG